MKAHFVTFYSPGTMFAEKTTKPVASWNVEVAQTIAADITERHNAKPYGFRFTTRERQDDELDSKEVDKSPMYYLGGKVETLAEVKARGDADDRTLISNMEGNGWDRIITATTGWKWSQPFSDDDVLLT